MRTLKSILCLLLLATPARAAVVGSWGFQDNAAGTIVVATTGSNMATFANTNTLTTTGPGGSFPLALTFNGTSHYVTPLPAHNTFSGATESVMARAKVTDVSINTRKQLILEAGGTTNGTVLYVYNGRIYYVNNQGGAPYYADATAPTDAGWHHYAGVKVSGTLYLYTDGVQVDTSSVTGTAAGSAAGQVGWDTADVSVGCRFHDSALSDGTNYFAGAICDVRLYNSDERTNIASIYAEGVTSSSAPQIIISRADRERSPLAAFARGRSLLATDTYFGISP